MKTTPVLFIVIPCYNEQEALPIMAMRLVGTTDDMLSKSLIDSASGCWTSWPRPRATSA